MPSLGGNANSPELLQESLNLAGKAATPFCFLKNILQAQQIILQRSNQQASKWRDDRTVTLPGQAIQDAAPVSGFRLRC